MYMENQCYPFVNLPLPYPADALEPFLDEKTMRLHHDRHLKTYIDNLNAVLADEPRLQKLSLEQLIVCAKDLPERLRVPVSRNAGGVYNHRFFFEGMAPPHAREGSCLEAEICARFGSMKRFEELFKKAELSVFGSGYAWLTYAAGRLEIITTANQNTPLTSGLCPLLTLDVWEHAYYLKHYNLRAEYVDDWMRVVNWQAADRNYLYCRSAPCSLVRSSRSG